MIQQPEIDRYAHLDSFIHRFDARLKMVSFLILIFFLVLLPDLKAAILGLGGTLLLFSLSRVPVRFAIRYLKWVLLFTLFFLIIMPFSVEGESLLHFYNLDFTREGLLSGVLISIRAVSAITLIFLAMATEYFEQNLKALYALKVPNILVQMFMFSYRYIFTFLEELQRTLTAMDARGFEMKTNLYTLRVLGKALGMLFVRGYERGERVYRAMQSRGYTGQIRTVVDFKIRKEDYVLSSSIIAFGLLLHLLSIWGWF